MKLIKKTSYPRSISLTQIEFEACSRMEYDAIEVRSPVGKMIRELPVQTYSRALSKAQILLVRDDPSNPHYWVVRF